MSNGVGIKFKQCELFFFLKSSVALETYNIASSVENGGSLVRGSCYHPVLTFLRRVYTSLTLAVGLILQA